MHDFLDLISQGGEDQANFWGGQRGRFAISVYSYFQKESYYFQVWGPISLLWVPVVQHIYFRNLVLGVVLKVFTSSSCLEDTVCKMAPVTCTLVYKAQRQFKSWRYLQFCGLSVTSGMKVEAHRLKILFSLSGLKAAELHGNLTQNMRLEARYLSDVFWFLLCYDGQ